MKYMNSCGTHSLVYVHFVGKAWEAWVEVKGAWVRSRDRELLSSGLYVGILKLLYTP